MWSWAAPISWRTTASLWLALVVLCGLRAYVGLAGTRIYSHDAFMVLDGAWRMLNGQRPHLDFNSMIGPAAYLPTVLGMYLSGNTAASFGYGQALVALLVGPWAYVLGSRLSFVPRVCFALCAAGIAISPAIIGPSPLEISPGMTYNRFSYALLSLILLECMQREGEWKVTRGFSSGAVLGILTFLKITAMGMGFVLIVAFGMLYPKGRQRWAGLLSGFALVAASFLFYLHFQLGPVLRDLAITIGAKHIAVAERYDLYSIFMEAGMAFAIVLAGASWLGTNRRSREAKQMLRAAGVVLLASVSLIFGNFQRSEVPLVTFFLILVMNQLASHTRNRSFREGAVLNMSLLAGSIYIAGTLFAITLSLAACLGAKAHTVGGATHFPTPALASFVPIGPDHSYTYYVNDGMQLLEAHRLPGEHVMCLDFTNPFSFGLWIPPARGGTTNLQFHGSFDEKHHVSAENLFGSSELVMMPRQDSDLELLAGLHLVYSPYLHSHYDLVEESRSWQLYRRRALPRPGVPAAPVQAQLAFSH